jgi:hypothetical protein
MSELETTALPRKRTRTTRPVSLALLFLFIVALLAPGAVVGDTPDPREKAWSLSTRLQLARERGEAPPQEWRSPESVMLPSGGPTDNPDVRPTLDNTTSQSENSIAVHPLDNSILLNSNNSTNWPVTQLYGTSWFISTNGGSSWFGARTGPGANNSGDPAACIDRNGKMYIGYISGAGGMGVAFTTNMGVNWTNVNVGAPGGADKNHLMVDNSAGSPFVGRLYNSWVDLGGGANVNDIVFSFSSNGGNNWSSLTNISNNVNAGSHNQGCNNQVGPNGEVYVTWSVYDAFPADETAIGFNRSTNGGQSWLGESRILTNIRGIRNTTLPNENTRANSFPSMAVDVSGGPLNGTIYIVWTNIGVPGVNTGDADIYLIRSTNQGVNWSTPVRVNQDATNRSQWFPWITCDPVTGELSVVFYDRRDDPGNLLTTAYVAHSVDGGVTWEDFRVGDAQFTPMPIPGLAGGYMGDYISCASNGGIAYPCWSDWRTSPITAYVSPVVYSPPSTDPNIVVSETGFTEELLEFGSVQRTFTVRNQGLVADTLDFTITENPEADWLTVAPTSGSLPANGISLITLDIDAAVLQPGDYSTTLDIASNDPSDPLKTVTVDLTVIGAPRMIVSTNNFGYTVLQGEQTLVSDYMLYNNGKGTLDYSVLISYLGGPGGNTEEFGNPVSPVVGSNRQRGNVYQINQSTILRELEMYLEASAPTNVDFFVYEGLASTGLFNRIFSSGPIPIPAGGQYHALDNIGVTMIAGRFYYVGLGWQGTAISYFDNAGPLPLPTSFGSLVYGPTSSGGNTYPPPASVNLTSTSQYYPQRLTTGFGIVSTMTTATSGSLADSSGTAQQFESVVDALAPTGTYSFEIVTSGNDPVTPEHTITLTINVVSTATGVEDAGGIVPGTFALHQNEPNPFNPATKIGFDLPQEGRVKLTVFDISGRRVASLVDGVLAQGRHEVPWQGRDDSGTEVSSGIYFLRMEAGTFTDRIKMSLVK